ncbi:MAG: hypothetical protein IAE89_10025 [Anaerolineae bacterium]|nr:hypothetical protein [Anaerolineae bacterium]
MSYAPDTDLETILTDVTDAVILGSALSSVFSAQSLREIAQFLPIIRLLSASYVAVRPSKRYTARLRHDLMGQEYTVVERVRYLPARVQIVAAAVAIAAGCLVLLRGRSALLNQSAALAEANTTA